MDGIKMRASRNSYLKSLMKKIKRNDSHKLRKTKMERLNLLLTKKKA